MEVKHNEATPNRPEGTRILDAPFIYIDTKKYLKQLREEVAWHKNDRNGITVFKNDRITIVIACLHAGVISGENVINEMIIIQAIEGSIEITLKEERFSLVNNQLMTIYPGIQYSIKAVEECAIMITTTVV